MESVSMVEFRRDAEAVIQMAKNGRRRILTYRGEPVLRLEPIAKAPDRDDPFFAMGDLADATAKSLSNEQIDREIYSS